MKIALLCLLIFLTFSTSAKTKLVVAVSSFEPWTIINESGISGIDMELIEQLASYQNLEVSHLRCPWIRCLKLLEEGKADIVSSVFKSKEREQYLSYFKSPYVHGNNRIFYLNKNTNITINSIEDLSSLRVGLRRGIKYFPEFDQQTQMNRELVNDNNQLIQMLLKNRIDTFIGQEDVVDYFLLKRNLTQYIKKANYKYFQVDEGYLAFSKKSKLLHLQPEMEKNLTLLINSNILEKLKDKYR